MTSDANISSDVRYFNINDEAVKLRSTKTILNPGEDEEFECFGYKRDWFKTVLTHIISILFCGLPYLIGHWKPEWRIKWYRSRCPLFLADMVLIQERSDVNNIDTVTPEVAEIIVKNVSENFIHQYVHRSDLLPEDFNSSSGNFYIHNQVYVVLN